MGNATLSMLDTHGLESGNPNKERLGPLSSYFDDFCWTDEGKPHPAAMLFGPLSGLSTIFDGTIASGIQESATNAHFKAAQIAADPNSGPVEVGMSYAMQPLIALGHVNAQGGLLASQGPYYRLLPISPVVNKFPILHRPIPGTPNFPGIRIRPIIVQPGVPTPIKVPSPKGISHLPKVQQRAVRSLKQQVADHQKKLADYLKNPDAFDNKGLLKNAPTPEIRHLQQEIKAFQDQIDQIIRGG